MGLSTENLADQLGIKGNSLRSAVCRAGSYFGLKPEVLPNGRLTWPDDSIARLKTLARAPKLKAARLLRAEKMRDGKVKDSRAGENGGTSRRLGSRTAKTGRVMKAATPLKNTRQRSGVVVNNNRNKGMNVPPRKINLVARER